MTVRGRSNYYLLTNKSGGAVTKGMSVIIDAANDSAFTTSTTAGDFRTMGVVADATIANDALGLIQLMGSIVPVMATSAAVTRGHYVKQGTVAGKVITTGTASGAAVPPPPGTLGIALTAAGGAGNIVMYSFNASPGQSAGVTAFTNLSDVPASFTGQTLKAVRVNAGETALEFYTPSSSAGIVTYNPDLGPLSPGTGDDEFDDDAIAGAWTQYGSPDICSETEHHGFIHITKTGTAVDAGIYKTYTPGAAAFTVVIKVSGNVGGAGSNQVLLAVSTSAGAVIVDVGMLNGSQWIVGAAALGGGFTSGNLTYATPNIGPIYFAITRDATTNYKVYTSPDGIIWQQIAGNFSQAGTVGRIVLQISPFSASLVDAWYDFVRTFTSQTTTIGRAP